MEERRLAAEIERAKIQLELARLQSNPNPGNPSQQPVEIKPRVPFSLPVFRESDQVDAYLVNFEKACQDFDIPKNQWLSRLRPQVCGKLQEVLNSLPVEVSADYDAAKVMILKRFSKTPEDCRRQFRSVRPLPSESYVDFMFRIQKLAKNWWEGKKIDSRQELEEVILTEQFLECLPVAVRLFLLDKGDQPLRHLAELADDYCLARSGSSSDPRFQAFTGGGISAKHSLNSTQSSNKSSKPKTDNPQNLKTSSSSEDRTSKKPLDPEARAERRCFRCQKPGHIARDCRSKQPENPSKSKESSSTSAFCQPTKQPSRLDKHISEGTVNGKPVRVLYDTGCDLVMIKNKFVEPEQFMGKAITVRSAFSDDVRQLPLAKIHLQCPFFTGEITVAVSPSLVCDVLFGQPLEEDKQDQGKESCAVTRSQTNSLPPQISRLVLQEAEPSGRDKPRLEQPPEKKDELLVATPESGQQPPERVQEVAEQIRQLRKADSMLCRQLREAKRQLEASAEPERDRLQEKVQEMTDQLQSVKEDMHRALQERSRLSKDRQRSVADPPVVEDRALEPSVSTQVRSSPVSGGKAFFEDLGQIPHTRQEISELQRVDPSLQGLRDLTSSPGEKPEVDVFWEDGVLFRRKKRDGPDDELGKQIVLPALCRPAVLELAHDSPLAGHFGIKKTAIRIKRYFYWPNIGKDVQTYCRSCDVCQRVGHPRDKTTAPLVKMKIIDVPFSTVTFDIVGPLPPTDKGNSYILVVCDLTSRYPEAFPLAETSSESVAKALIQLFSRVGFPSRILCDNATNFNSNLMNQMWNMCGIKQSHSSPYHPQCCGVVERTNQTLKRMLRKFTTTYPLQWDELLPLMLYAIRSIPNETTGFSPFEILYGRPARGPLEILHEAWTSPRDEESNLVQFVVDLKTRLKETLDLALLNSDVAKDKQKKYYDRKASPRAYQVGQKVLLLNKAKRSKFEMTWVGPYTVIEKLNDVDYRLETPGKRKSDLVVHVNLIKPYVERIQATSCSVSSWVGQEPDSDSGVELVKVQPEPSSDHDLSRDQKRQLERLVGEFPHLFSDKPGVTDLVEHEISLEGDSVPSQKPYRISHMALEQMKKEVQELLDLGIVRESNSPYASPALLVKKDSGKAVRLVVDFRQLNKTTVNDSYPMRRIDDTLDRIGKAKFLSAVDLSKGYLQVKLKESSIPKTAFVTPFGLFEYTRMCFGLKNSGRTFQRLMDRLLRDCQDFAIPYIDDVVVFSDSWEEHVEHLRKVFTKISQANLTIKPGKCQFARKCIRYLGFVVGSGQIAPDPDKVATLRNIPRPHTKKQVRAFLGAVNYYSRFIPRYAQMAAPLMELTRSSIPSRVPWSEGHQRAFESLRSALENLVTSTSPDFEKPFLVLTDASSEGIAGCLAQVDSDGFERPVLFISRKLSGPETRYSTIEQEALAIVWSISKLRHYLEGQKFTLVTDHKPLAWLDRKAYQNGRLARWSLGLQAMEYEILHRPGKMMQPVDFLSRAM